MRMRKYFYHKLQPYLGLYIRPEDRVFEIDVKGTAGQLNFRSHSPSAGAISSRRRGFNGVGAFRPDYVLLNGNIHYETDIHEFLEQLRKELFPPARTTPNYYSNLWRPLLRLATALGLRSQTPEENWIAPEDLRNLLLLAGYELVREESKLLVPVYIPLISYLANRFLAPLPGFRLFNLLNIAVARRSTCRLVPPRRAPLSRSSSRHGTKRGTSRPRFCGRPRWDRTTN